MDHIKNLLSQTGWSCEELLQKLNEFKKTSHVNVEPGSSEAQCDLNNTESKQVIKKCSADSTSTEVQHKSDYDEGSSPCDIDSSLTHTCNENQQEFKWCLNADTQLKSSYSEESVRESIDSESSQKIKECYMDSSSTEVQQQSDCNKRSFPYNTDSSLTHPHNEESESQQEFKLCFPFNTETQHKSINSKESVCNSMDTQSPHEITEYSANSSSTEVQHKLDYNKKNPPCDVDCSITQICNERNESQQEFKQCTEHAEIQYKSSDRKESDGQTEFKKFSSSNADENSTQQSNYEEQHDNQQEHSLYNVGENSMQQELKKHFLCNAKESSMQQSSNEEQSKIRQELKRPFLCTEDSSSRQAHHSTSNEGEDESQPKIRKSKAELINSTEIRHNPKNNKENKFETMCSPSNYEKPKTQCRPNNAVTENGVPPGNGEPKNNEVDASDHNYIKKISTKDCNLKDDVNFITDVVLLQEENCTNKSEAVKITNMTVTKRAGQKLVNFKSRFLYRIKRSYRVRCQHKNVKRSQLIPRQSRRNTEGVRNQILQQLELLRNRRTSDFGKDFHQTITPGLTEPLLYKKRLSNEKVKNETASTSSASATNAENTVKVKEEEEKAINEIMTAQEPSSNSYMIKPTKTKDITKIKGWKHKKFISLDDVSATKSCCNSVTVTSTPTCSYKEKSDENQQDIPCENQETNVFATSAFASNNLDGFLYESADLQISFQIPKLASGEDCPTINTAPFTSTIETQSEPKEEEKEEEVDQDENVESVIINGDTENLLKIHKITNLYKPRTVAQRRRIWRLKNDARIKQDESMQKPRTLAEKRRLMNVSDESKRFLPTKRSASETNFFDEDLKYSYVLYRGKKIKVPTPTQKGVIAYIKYSYNKKDYIYVPKKRKESLSKAKPSIFNTNAAVKSNAIKYRPGPLCKKVELQVENKTWRTVIKKLPKVYLEITPEVNRPIHPSLLHFLPEYQLELTAERVEFALSALCDKNQHNNKTTFTFPVAYANHQEGLLFREKIISNDVKLDPQQDSEILITDVIKDVVSKMVDYVEIKDVAEEIFIKEDVNIKCRDEEISMKSTIKANPKRKLKKSKTNYELKRLNVKVIEVDLEDKGDIVNCNKEYCKLGCICKSLATTSSLVSNHCGIPDCMFECTCNYDRKSRGNLKIILPVGIDVLSERAVSRLEDEAKKNLAKVEKEFTQTVIQANNQTIVVGGHCNRQRRLTKAPRKYNDFIDDPDLLLENENGAEEPPSESAEETKVLPHIEWKPCSVKVPRLKLKQVIPFCLVHNLHNCHCHYKAQFKITPAVDTKTKYIPESNVKFRRVEKVPKSYLNYDGQSSARTRGISTSYYVVRNRTQEFISTRKKKLERLYKEYLEKLYMGDEIDIHAHSEVEVTKLKKKDENINIDDVKQVRSTRRKQQLTVREDTVNLQTVKKPEFKKQFIVERPKHKVKLKQAVKSEEKKIASELKQATEKNKRVSDEVPLNPSSVNEALELNNVIRDDTLPKFDNLLFSSKHSTDLLTPSTAVRKKFLQLLGKKNECDAQFRLMPWSGLASRYEGNKLQLWYSSFYKVPKIIVTDNVVAPKHFTNIQQFESVQDKSLIRVDLIRWLVTKTVPGGKCKDDILVILQLTKTHCEVCGICEKTCMSPQSNENMLLAIIPSFLTENNNEGHTETIEVDNLLNFETTDEQKKQHAIAKKIKFSKCKYPEVILEEIESIDSSLTQDDTSKRIISTHLPHVNKNSQWRMIQLNSDFSILSLLRNNYAIKYSDLLRIVRIAQSTYTTVVLKTPEIEENYPHPDFGLFAAPNCEEKIFIGPYFHYECHDVSTLRYVNRVLVKTELFNQMKGKAPTNNGWWLKQVQGQAVPKKSLQTIDLTLADSDNETEFIETQSPEVKDIYTPPSRSLLKQSASCNDDKERVVLGNNLPVSNMETVQQGSSKGKSIFTIDDVASFEMSAADFEVKVSSSDCVLEEDNTVNVRNFENQLYFVPNVPLMGYILAHKLRTITIVRWPTLNNAKRFYKIEEAVSWVEKEITNYFIIPPNFRISIKVKTELTPGISEAFDPKYLKGYYLATKYGVKNLLNINLQTLKILDVTSEELELLARRRANKMIYDTSCEIAKQFIPSETLKAKSCSEVIDLITSEVKMQRRTEIFYIKRQQQLLSKKQKLVDNLSSVIKDISPYVSNKTKSAMLDILKRHKIPSQIQQDKPSEKDNDVVCITIDSDEEAYSEAPPNPVKTPPPVIPKITVRNLHDLRDPNLNKLPENGNTVIVTKKKRSEVLKALQIKSAGSNSIDSKIEKIHLFPISKQAFKNLTQEGSIGVKQNSGTTPTNTNEETVSIIKEPKGVKRKLKPIYSAISKCIIKTPTGKLIKVNAEQLKSIQNKGIILAPVKKEINSLDNGKTVFTNHTSHGGFVKMNLDDAVSPQFLRKTSESSNVQSSSSS